MPVLILSMHAEEQYAVRASKAGAAGYMTKGQFLRRVAPRHLNRHQARSIRQPSTRRENRAPVRALGKDASRGPFES